MCVGGGRVSNLPTVNSTDRCRARHTTTESITTFSMPYSDGSDIHIAFTASCNNFQHWQTEVVLHSAQVVGFRGQITRIVVGCEKQVDAGAAHTYAPGELDEVVSIERWKRSTNALATLHMAPHPPFTKRFPWLNKAWGFYHWSQHGTLGADVVAIIDPDQFFLAPLTQNVMPRTSWQPIALWKEQSDVSDAARPGMAVAQEYGIGDVFTRRFNRTKVCGAGSACATVTSRQARKYYAIGVPYLLHRDDFKPVMRYWWQFMPESYKQDPGDIQVDMYAYVMAAAHAGVRHVTMKHYMVSAPPQPEGWPGIDAVGDMPCRQARLPDGWSTPTFAHACQGYKVHRNGGSTTAMLHRLGHTSPRSLSEADRTWEHDLWLFHKGHVPPKILDCAHPLLRMPPDDLIAAQTSRIRKRRAFMVCALHRLINDAARAYKRSFCTPAPPNEEECVKISLGGFGDSNYPGRFAKRVNCTPASGGLT
jgi:hypothetical protein